jgi:hypothetical protein
MKKTIITGLIAVVFLGLSTAAQDWYHDRDARYRGISGGLMCSQR